MLGCIVHRLHHPIAMGVVGWAAAVADDACSWPPGDNPRLLLAPGRRIGPYQIVAAIGSGGMGEVYLASDSRLGRQVAIKILNARSSTDDTARARFLREAQLAASLDHPNICTLHEIGSDGDLDYLVMQHVSGETLAERLARSIPGREEAIGIAVQLAEALTVAHSHRVIHRDIKPQNVMITRDGRAKLMDFGLAKVPGRLDADDETRASLTEAGNMLGTVQAMAPEQLEGRPADERSDIFSLGIVLFQLFSGRHPFAGPTPAATIAAIALRPAPLLGAVAPDAIPALDRIVAKTLAMKPEHRYQSAADLLVDLKSVQRGDGPSTPRAQPSGRSRRRMAVISLVAVMAIAAAGTAFYPRRSAPATPAAPAVAFNAWVEIERPANGAAPQRTRAAGDVTVRSGWRMRVQAQPYVAGSLYVLADERDDRSRQTLALWHAAAAAAGRQFAGDGDWARIGDSRTQTDVWVVWSAAPISELERLTVLLNDKDRGIIRDDREAERIRKLLADGSRRSIFRVAPDGTSVVVSAPPGIVAHKFLVREE